MSKGQNRRMRQKRCVWGVRGWGGGGNGMGSKGMDWSHIDFTALVSDSCMQLAWPL